MTIQNIIEDFYKEPKKTNSESYLKRLEYFKMYYQLNKEKYQKNYLKKKQDEQNRNNRTITNS